jgi:hypothetical protein
MVRLGQRPWKEQPGVPAVPLATRSGSKAESEAPPRLSALLCVRVVFTTRRAEQVVLSRLQVVVALQGESNHQAVDL